MSVSWVAIQSAIRLWISNATSLDGAHVIWADQDGPRPSGPYIVMRLTPRRVGHGWTAHVDNGTGTAGAEITYTHTSIRALELELQCFAGEAQGASSSHALLDLCVDYAGLPSQMDAFRAAGWAPATFDPVQSISGVLGGSTFEPRAVLRCRGMTSSQITETGTYIELAEVRDSISEPNRGLIVDLVDQTVTIDPKFVAAHAVIRFAATGDGVISGDLNATASATMEVSVAATPIAIFAASASASMMISVSGAVTQDMVASGSADAELSAESEIFLLAIASASASMSASASGAVTQDMLATASASLTASTTGDGTLVSGGPNLLLDLDFTAPVTSWTTGRTGFSSAFATDEWLMQSHTGGSYANNVGIATLDDDGGGGLTDQTCTLIYDGAGYGTRTAWEATDTLHQLECSDTAVGEMEGANLCVRIVFRHTSVLSSDYLISKQNGFGTAGWALYTTSLGRLVLYISDGTTHYTSTLTPQGLNDGALHYLTLFYDDSANTISVTVDGTEVLSSASITATGSHTQARPLTVNGNTVGSVSGLPTLQVAYVGICEGAGAISMYNETFWQHATDPTGLLDTKTRASAIGVMLSASTVGTFGPGQIAIGGSGLFTSGMGLATNTAKTNLVTYSRASTGATNSNVSASDNASDGADGFRIAQRLTASANNGYQARVCTTVASTAYVASVWIKESTVGVTGRVIMYDESNGAELGSTAYTATGTWQRVQVAAATVGGGVSTSVRVEVDTSGESVDTDMWQLELGSQAGHIIHTNGASASLVAASYAAVDSAGMYCEGASGEIQLIAYPLTKSGSQQVYLAASNATNNNDSRIIETSAAGNWVATVYDSTGSSASSLDEGAATASNEETLLLRWDNTGGLALGGGEEASLSLDGSAAATTVGTFTAANTVTTVQVGADRSAANGIDGFIQRVRIWDAEGGA